MPTSTPEPVAHVEKVYVAGSSLELDRVDRAVAALENAGIIVTSTWPISVRDAGTGNPIGATREQRVNWTITDLAQVRAAELFWFLVPPRDVATRGAWMEAGYALAKGRVCIFSGDTKQSIFSAVAYEYADDAAALMLILRLADKEHAALDALGELAAGTLTPDPTIESVRAKIAEARRG